MSQFIIALLISILSLGTSISIEEYISFGSFDLLLQSRDYALNDLVMDTNLFIMCVKGGEVAYFYYVKDFHSSRQMSLKSPDFDGLLGIYMDQNEVKILPQHNVFYPQIKIYKLFNTNKSHIFSNHCIQSFIAKFKTLPRFYDNNHQLSFVMTPHIVNPKTNIPDAQFNTATRLGLGLDLTGRLTQIPNRF